MSVMMSARDGDSIGGAGSAGGPSDWTGRKEIHPGEELSPGPTRLPQGTMISPSGPSHHRRIRQAGGAASLH